MQLTDLEHSALNSWRRNGDPAGMHGRDEIEEWTCLALRLSLVAARHVRAARLGDLVGPVRFKTDHSPVTALEVEVEQLLRAELARAPLPVRFLGEETADDDNGHRITVAVDPVDGTWSLLNRTETAATSLALLRDGEPFLGVVANPATAEIAYAAPGQSPRLLQLGALGEEDRAVSLPIPRVGPDGLLVSLHPQRAASAVATALSKAWQRGELDMVRSAGGAPSLGLLEVAKGNFVYVNLWDRRTSEVWDLTAGLMLVRASGGEAVDLQGNPVHAVGHRGPFVAALSAANRQRVLELTSQALQATG
jgi:myo-inositol-1(or 4)-monophosphatase